MIEMYTLFAVAPFTGQFACSAGAMIEEPDTPEIRQLADSLDEIVTRLGVNMLLEAELEH